MYVKIEDIVGNIKTKKYSGILIIFVNTIKPSEMTAFQIWSAKPRRIRRGLLLLKSVTTVNGGDSGDALFENIKNNSHRIERCKYRDSVLNGALSYCNAVLIMHA